MDLLSNILPSAEVREKDGLEPDGQVRIISS